MKCVHIYVSSWCQQLYAIKRSSYIDPKPSSLQVGPTVLTFVFVPSIVLS